MLDGSLEIKDVQVSDEGHYIIKTTNYLGKYTKLFLMYFL